MHTARIVQDGTPRDLYERPATRFIADFIGNANLLPVTVARAEDGTAHVSLAGTAMRVPHRGLPDGAAVLAVRPEAIRIHRGPGPAGGLGAVVRKAAYLGDHMEYEVALDGLAGEVFVIDNDVVSPLQAGARIGVAIAPGGAVLVPA